jgi:hypothetical protein
MLVAAEPTATVTVTLGVPFSGTVITPEKSSNRPRTLPTARWRTENVMDEWTGSIVHVPGVRSRSTVESTWMLFSSSVGSS